MKSWRMLVAALAIPLSSRHGWEDLSFRRIQANKTEFSSSGLQITVDSSASPLVYRISSTAIISAIQAEIEIQGGHLNGKSDFPEDSYLRIGLVSPGPRTLGFWERQTAAEWVRRLFALAPKGLGIDRIYFFNLTDSRYRIGQQRILPQSQDLIEEQIMALRPSGQNKISINYKLPRPLPTAALWLSSDGDDTKSSYVIKIKKLILDTIN